MAVARKCDRCGKFFAPNISNYGNKHSFVRLNTYYTTGTKAGGDIHNVDLCNECNQSLEEWIAQEHKNKDIRDQTIEEFATKMYEEFDKYHDRMALIQFEKLHMLMKGEVDDQTE